MYYGCSTIANRLAWTAFFILLLLSFGFLIALEIHTRACIVGWAACGGQGLVNMATGYLATVRDAGSELGNVTSFCDSLFGEQQANNSQAVDVCEYCTAEATQCLRMSGLLATAMLTAMLGTVLPFFFFCCCADVFRPHIPPEVEAEIQKVQESAARKASVAAEENPAGSAWH